MGTALHLSQESAACLSAPNTSDPQNRAHYPQLHLVLSSPLPLKRSPPSLPKPHSKAAYKHYPALSSARASLRLPCVAIASCWSSRALSRAGLFCKGHEKQHRCYLTRTDAP